MRAWLRTLSSSSVSTVPNFPRMCRSNVGRPKQGVKFTLCGNSGPANGQCIGREGDWTWPFAGPRPAARVDAPVERAGACGWMVTRARPRSSQPSASRFGRDQSALVAPQIEARAPQAVATPVQFDTRGTVHSLRGTHASSARPALTSTLAKRVRARDPAKESPKVHGVRLALLLCTKAGSSRSERKECSWSSRFTGPQPC